MWFCSFFITYQRKQARQSRIAVVPVPEKSWSRTDRPVFLTFEKPLCKDIHGPGPVHTHHLPQGVAPARVRCPAGGRQTFIYFFSLKAPVVFFSALVFSHSPGNCCESWTKIQKRMRRKRRIPFFDLWWPKEKRSIENGGPCDLMHQKNHYMCRSKSQPHLELSSLLHSHLPAELPCKLRPALRHTCNTKTEQHTNSVGSWNCTITSSKTRIVGKMYKPVPLHFCFYNIIK